MVTRGERHASVVLLQWNGLCWLYYNQSLSNEKNNHGTRLRLPNHRAYQAFLNKLKVRGLIPCLKVILEGSLACSPIAKRIHPAIYIKLWTDWLGGYEDIHCSAKACFEHLENSEYQGHRRKKLLILKNHSAGNWATQKTWLLRFCSNL